MNNIHVAMLRLRDDISFYVAGHVSEGKIIEVSVGHTYVKCLTSLETPDSYDEVELVLFEDLWGKISEKDDIIMEGTDFQKKVWNFLMNTTSGDIFTYSEIARRIGHPGAQRAVANACASNRHAIVIPCHRVVRKDGKPSGYRWGEEVRVKILAAGL